ncbi:MAG: pyridoxamine 5'-phosphate oxidase family protein [Candidatus Omnitrophica bacterium]|nr:pyridoxamine 5'-phosphate oxidase family protein [Candidatus Omnitrophota bacterium]
MQLPLVVIQFFQAQGCVLVSTIDDKGMPHNACKGIVEIKSNGEVYLLDLYRQKTYRNLLRNPNISITAFDEHKFKGYCLKGKAKVIKKEEIDSKLIRAWENKITSRLAQRILKNIHREKGHLHHPEALLPKPQYLIEVQVKEVVDLTPRHLR